MDNFNSRYSRGIQAELGAIRARNNLKYQTDLMKNYQAKNQANFEYLNKTLKEQNEDSTRANIFTAGTTSAQLGYKLYKYSKKKKLEKLKKAQEEQRQQPEEKETEDDPEPQELGPEDDEFLQEEFRGAPSEKEIELRELSPRDPEPEAGDPEPEPEPAPEPAPEPEEDFEAEPDYPEDTIGDNPFEEQDFEDMMNRDYVGDEIDDEEFDPYRELYSRGPDEDLAPKVNLSDDRPLAEKISSKFEDVKGWFNKKYQNVREAIDRDTADPFETMKADREASAAEAQEYSEGTGKQFYDPKEDENIFGRESPVEDIFRDEEPDEAPADAAPPPAPAEADIVDDPELLESGQTLQDAPEYGAEVESYVTKGGYNIPKLGDPDEDAMSDFSEAAEKALKRSSGEGEPLEGEAGEAAAGLEEGGEMAGLETADLVADEVTAGTAAVPVVGEVAGVAAGVIGAATLGYGAYKYVSDHPHMMSKMGSDIGDFFTGKFSDMTNPFSNDTPPPSPTKETQQTAQKLNLGGSVVGLGQTGQQY